MISRELKNLREKNLGINNEINQLLEIEEIILEIIRLAYEINNTNNTAYNIGKAEKLYYQLIDSNWKHKKFDSMQDIFRNSLFEGVLRRRDEIDLEIEKLEHENE